MKNPHKIKRTITEVLNYETGECIDSFEFFQKPIDQIIVFRSELQKAIEGIRGLLFTCYYCRQKIRIRGGISHENASKSEIFHFAHLKDSDDCHIKTKNKFSREEVDRIKYNGEKESVLHRTLKENIAQCLRKNEQSIGHVSSVEVEKVIKAKVEKEWKKPDINVFYKENRMAIELQLSTTWLNVITKRQHFYKEQGIFIFWIFNKFDLEDDTRKLTFDDVIFTNNQNAYVFNYDNYERSILENDLVIKCYYKTYKRNHLNLEENWSQAYIKLSDLIFDEINCRVYYFDSEGQKEIIEQEIKEEIKQNAFEEAERKRKWEVASNKVIVLNEEINEISIAKSGLVNTENKLNSNLDQLTDFMDKIKENTKKIIIHFSSRQNFTKPFYGHDKLYEVIKEKYGKEILNCYEISSRNEADLKVANTNLNAIGNQLSIEISGMKYATLNSLIDWGFITRHFTQVKIIPKDRVNGLFAKEEIKLIANEIELNRIQYAKDIYFLFDFTEKKDEFLNTALIAQQNIKKQEEIISSLHDNIKIELVNYFNEAILKSKLEIEAISNKRIELTEHIEAKIEEIKLVTPFNWA